MVEADTGRRHVIYIGRLQPPQHWSSGGLMSPVLLEVMGGLHYAWETM